LVNAINKINGVSHNPEWSIDMSPTSKLKAFGIEALYPDTASTSNIDGINNMIAKTTEELYQDADENQNRTGFLIKFANNLRDRRRLSFESTASDTEPNTPSSRLLRKMSVGGSTQLASLIAAQDKHDRLAESILIVGPSPTNIEKLVSDFEASRQRDGSPGTRARGGSKASPMVSPRSRRGTMDSKSSFSSTYASKSRKFSAELLFLSKALDEGEADLLPDFCFPK
jgi:hypothetical protein